MKIIDITQTPFGTILSLSKKIPSHALEMKLSDGSSEPYTIKGTPSDVWTEVLIDKTDELKVGQNVHFLKHN